MSNYCYFFGYGSLLFSNGYLGRKMKHPPKENEMIHFVKLKGYRRGMYNVVSFKGKEGINSYFSITPDKHSSVVGAIAPIKTEEDFHALMKNEGAYMRVPTYEIRNLGIYKGLSLFTLVCPKDSIGKFDYDNIKPSPGYIEYIFRQCDSGYKSYLFKDIGKILSKFYKIERLLQTPK